ncbi:phosphate ABC transporter, permease protein PstA, partial [Planococcus sp. SIMBA_143]
MKYINQEQVQSKMNRRLIKNNIFKKLFALATMFGIVVLAILIIRVLTQGLAWIDMDFITGKLSTSADRAGIMGAILGTLWLMIV